MISKTIIVLAIAVAFVAGTMVTGTTVLADEDENKSKNAKLSLGDLFGLLMELETQIISMQTQIQLLTIGGTGEQGPQGSTGETGPSGADGAAGPAGPIQTVTRIVGHVTIEPQKKAALLVNCPEGTVVTGGGYNTNSLVRLEQNKPQINPQGWFVSAQYLDAPSNAIPTGIQVYALCMTQ